MTWFWSHAFTFRSYIIKIMAAIIHIRQFFRVLLHEQNVRYNDHSFINKQMKNNNFDNYTISYWFILGRSYTVVDSSWHTPIRRERNVRSEWGAGNLSNKDLLFLTKYALSLSLPLRHIRTDKNIKVIFPKSYYCY